MCWAMPFSTVDCYSIEKPQSSTRDLCEQTKQEVLLVSQWELLVSNHEYNIKGKDRWRIAKKWWKKSATKIGGCLSFPKQPIFCQFLCNYHSKWNLRKDLKEDNALSDFAGVAKSSSKVWSVMGGSKEVLDCKLKKGLIRSNLKANCKLAVE